jgi:cyclophilin family peptidyl-prolyl cis-trans isomerase
MFVRVIRCAVAALVLAGAASSSFAQGAPAAAASSPGAGPIISFETEKGTFEFETYPNEAPKTVAHIIALVNRKFYNGQRVHRVVAGFVIQMGDPASRDMTKKEEWGRGGSGSPIGVAEFSKTRTHVKYAVAMAHAGDATKADSQFYVCLSDVHRLDGSYTVFGKLVSGMDVVGKIAVGDRIIRATVKAAQ